MNCYKSKCNFKAHSRGMCPNHYQEWLKNGSDLLALPSDSLKNTGEIFAVACMTGEVQKLIDDGYNVMDLIHEFQSSRPTVRKYVNKYGINVPPSFYAKEQYKTAVEIWTPARRLAMCQPWVLS